MAAWTFASPPVGAPVVNAASPTTSSSGTFASARAWSARSYDLGFVVDATSAVHSGDGAIARPAASRTPRVTTAAYVVLGRSGTPWSGSTVSWFASPKGP